MYSRNSIVAKLVRCDPHVSISVTTASSKPSSNVDVTANLRSVGGLKVISCLIGALINQISPGPKGIVEIFDETRSTATYISLVGTADPH